VRCCSVAVLRLAAGTSAGRHDVCGAPGSAVLAPSANGSVVRRAASSQRRVRQQDAYRVFPATRMSWGWAPRDCEGAHTECCVRVWCWIERPRGRDWVCVCHGAGSREGSGGAGENGLGVEGRGLL